MDRLSKASSLPDALELIKDTDIGRYLEETSIKNFDDADRYLWQYFGKCFESLEWLRLMPSEMRKILNAYRVKYDVVNVKAVLQGISIGKKANLVPVGVIHHRGLLDELSRTDNIDQVREILIECDLGTYASMLESYGEEAKSKFITEAKLDREFYQNLLGLSKGIKDGSLLAKTFSIILDMTNLQLVSRAIIEGIGSEAEELVIGGGYMIPEAVAKDLLSYKLAEIPGMLGGTQYRDIAEEIVTGYDRTKSITAVEEVIDKHRFRLLKEMLSPRVMTPLMIAWYLVAKEVEVKNLRLVLKAIFDNISVEEITEYLVLAS
jgi:V/A-type H+-transporting ATPase subunit C